MTRQSFRGLIVATFALSAVICGPAFAAGQGKLVIVGGGLRADNTAVYSSFIEHAGGAQNAKIGIVPTASSKPVKNGNKFKQRLVDQGVPEDRIELIPIAVRNDKSTEDVDESTWIDNAKDAALAERVKGLSGIWFIGGDQTRITKALLRPEGVRTPVLEAIWAAYEGGAVIGGTSAGAAVMSDAMIAGGDSLGALLEGATEENRDDYEKGAVIVLPGIGFFPHGTLDQHFDRRGRLGRLIVVAMDRKDSAPMGFGVDEDTAMVVDNATGLAEVVGAGAVTIADASQATRSGSGAASKILGLRLHVMAEGDAFDLNKKALVPAKSKFTTVGEEYWSRPAPQVTGVFSDFSRAHELATFELVDNSKAGEAVSYVFGEDGQGFKLSFRQDEKTQGYWGSNGGKDLYAAENVILDITPVKVSITPVE